MQHARAMDLGDYASRYTPDFAAHYDAMVGWDARRASEGEFFLEILRAHNVHSVLDAACGTGFHAVELARAGFDVTAVDGARTMVDKAAENFAAEGAEIPLALTDWRRLSDTVERSFDAVLCVGDSFSHLFDEADRRRSLMQFHDALSTGGVLLIDHRNYDALAETGHDHSMTRDYCCCGDQVKMALDFVESGVVHNRYTIEDTIHELYTYPMRTEEMEALLAGAGFSSMRTYGDYDEDFERSEVSFIVHLAQRG